MRSPPSSAQWCTPCVVTCVEHYCTVYVCVCVCVCVYIYIYMHIYIHVHMYINTIVQIVGKYQSRGGQRCGDACMLTPQPLHVCYSVGDAMRCWSIPLPTYHLPFMTWPAGRRQGSEKVPTSACPSPCPSPSAYPSAYSVSSAWPEALPLAW
jgi:hypothetical protein